MTHCESEPIFNSLCQTFLCCNQCGGARAAIFFCLRIRICIFGTGFEYFQNLQTRYTDSATNTKTETKTLIYFRSIGAIFVFIVHIAQKKTFSTRSTTLVVTEDPDPAWLSRAIQIYFNSNEDNFPLMLIFELK